MKRITVVVLAVSLLMLFGALAPAFAKNFNYPEGQDITYSSGGEGFIVPPVGSFGPATSMRIGAADVEIGSKGGGDNIEIDFPFPTTEGPIYLPIAFFTTNSNPDLIDWVQTIMSGLPAALFGNIRYVSDDVLIVSRHGNSITVELTAPQTIMMGTGPVVVPVFTVELNKVGGSVHQEETVLLTGYPDASGYTGYVEEMGFNAEGAFTCPAWSYNSVPMTDCFITMHGITIYTPPASP